MATSSILGGERAAQQTAGRDVDALGPSDSSDSGSDVQGERAHATVEDDGEHAGALPVILDSDTDAGGTGERASAVPEGVADGADIAPDRIGSVDDDASIDDATAPDVADLAAGDDDDLTVNDGPLSDPNDADTDPDVGRPR